MSTTQDSNENDKAPDPGESSPDFLQENPPDTVNEIKTLLEEMGKSMRSPNLVDSGLPVPPRPYPDMALISKNIRERIARGESFSPAETRNVLTGQIHSLDTLISHVLENSHLDTNRQVDTRRLQVALRAQQLCVQTAGLLQKMQEKMPEKMKESTNEMKE